MRWINLGRAMPSKGTSAINLRKRPIPRSPRLSLRSFGIAFIATFCLGGPAWLWQSGWTTNALHLVWQAVADGMAENGMRVEEVILQGRLNESPKDIKRVLGIQLGAPMLSIDLQNVRERLEALPWIRLASLERQYPSTIRINIVERQPTARWQLKNKLVLIDTDGNIITSQKLEKFSDLIVVVGKGAPIEASSLMSIFAREPELKKRVNAAVRVGNRRWDIVMDNGVYVRLPEKKPEVAWRRFGRLEREHKLLKQDLLSIDLRIPDQMIVRTRANPPTPKRKVNVQKGKST